MQVFVPEIRTARVPAAFRRRAAACCLLLLLLAASAGSASEAETILSGMQQRYAAAGTISGSFRLTYRDFGIEQAEWGVFRLAKPARMRWEYAHPKGKLFVADGKESFLYVPEDNQVTVQSFTAVEMENTPLRFLLGSEDFAGSFFITSESASEARFEGSQVVRLTPKGGEPGFSWLLLEIDRNTRDLLRLVMREHSGNTLEYVFSDMQADVAVSDKEFKFTIPPGAEVLRMVAE